MKESRKVTYRALKKGQKICGSISGNTYHSFAGYVQEITPAFVTVELWRPGSGKFDKIPSDAQFLIELSEEEIMDKYDRDAGEIARAIQRKLHRDEIGSKEMWNAWLSPNPWEMAQKCKEYKLTVIGHCTDIAPKRSISGDLLDAGVCAEEEDGERIWCHFRSRDIKLMLERYERRRKYKEEGRRFHINEDCQKIIDEMKITT